MIAGTDNFPRDYAPETTTSRRIYGNSILRSEDPLGQPAGGAYAHDIVPGFNKDEDAKAYGLKAYADGEVWLAMKDDDPPWKADSPSSDNHHKDSSVWISMDDGKTWRKTAVGRHALTHDNPESLPAPRGFGNIASSVQARITGDFVFVNGTYPNIDNQAQYRIFRFRRFAN